MFDAGERKTAEEVFRQDYKVYVHGETKFGVGQGSYMSPKSRESARSLLSPYLDTALTASRMDMIFYMLTDIPDGSTEVIYAGADAEETLAKAFGIEPDHGRVVLKDVVSRKKQFIPSLLRAFSTD